MKVVFLCGSLEQGHDGVGDYTRRLGAELIKHNHEVAAVALMDNGVADVVSDLQHSDCIDLPVLRLPYAMPEKKRFEVAVNWVESFSPELISLQFVIFSFHKKGLPFNLSKLLSDIGPGRTWHIMFHELWIGIPTHASKKHYVWGWLQREIIKSIIERLSPQIIHTHTWLYQELLLKIGFKADMLPLFSNIGYTGETQKAAVPKRATSKEANKICLVAFGSLHPYSQLDVLANEAALLAKKTGTDVTLQALGKCGPEIKRWVIAWEAVGLKIEVLGEQSPERISEVLSNASIGITTTALPMIQKSGSVAAMKEHGLPIICISGPWQPRGVEVLEPPDGIFEISEGVLEECLRRKTKYSSPPSVSEVARLFVESIEGSK